VVACSKKDPEPEPTSTCRLTEVKKEGPEPWANWQSLSYDEQGRLSEVIAPTIFNNSGDVITLHYDGAGRRSEMRVRINDSGTYIRTQYSYNAAGQLDAATLQTVFDVNTIRHISSFAFHYTKGQLTSILRSDLGSNDPDMQVLYTYTYDGKKLVRIELTPLGRPENKQVAVFTYDDKKRPDYIGMMPTLGDENRYYEDFLNPTGPHNVLSVSREHYYNGKWEKILIYRNTYTYNSQGYPTQQVVTFPSGEEQRFTYAYDCE
jgi:YD repeat-containing protein